MWFGTNGGGITKFDGLNYESIKDKDGLADNLVYSIVKDNKGKMFIGTNNGLSIYDGKKFKNYTTANGLTHNRVYSILFASNGKVLLGTGSGVCIFQDSICKKFDTKSILDSAIVFNISEDSQKNLWFCTIGNGIFKYSDNRIQNFTNQNGFKNNYIYSIIEISPDKYWVAGELGVYELYKQKITPINLPDKLKGASFYNFFRYNDSSIFIASNNGVIKYSNNKTVVFTQENGLVSNEIWKIFQDSEKNLWFASKASGVSKLPTERFYSLSEKDGIISNTINRIFQSKNGDYWIGSKNGISVVTNNKIKNYSQKDLKFNTEVTAFAEELNKVIYIGTSYGLIKFKDNAISRIEADDTQPGLNYIHDILVDSKNEIWLGTKYGVAKIINNKIVGINNSNAPINFVYKIFEDTKHNYWFGTENGLYFFDEKKFVQYTELEGFYGKRVYNIIPNKNAEGLLFATNVGIIKFEHGKFQTFISEKNGLTSNNTQSIIFDNQSNLWIGLPNGVDKIKFLSKNNFSIKHYGLEDGFTGEACIFNSILVDNQNKVWFGAEKGLVVYQPQYDRDNTLEPITRIKNIQLFGQKTDWKNFATSFDDNNLPVDLTLPFNKNYFTFNFIGVSQTTPAKVVYKYMLKGLDKNWSEETHKTEALYQNLPPCEYEFLVMANNGEGVWNKQPVSFKFTISPPFWQTWWFYSIIAAIVISGIYSYIKIKSANIKIVKQNHIIEKQNSELNNANLIIASKNKNITDSINYAQRIQQSFLSSEGLLNECLKEYFILFKPRDIVSGDFYWAYDLPDRTLIACADSTGHGIPGAFMSLIGISLLNEISHSKKMVEPAVMLEELRRIIICALNPDQDEYGAKDGMDIVLISLMKPTSESDEIKIHFAGANNTLYIASNKNAQLELLEYKGDKQPVGFYSAMKPFTQKEITAYKGDIIYMFTDGYADQFGGPKEKKFMSRQLKNTLLEISNRHAQEQCAILNKTFVEWQGDQEQVDDVTIIGIRV